MTKNREKLLEEAAIYEAEIAETASEIRGDAKELTPELFMDLYPLLKEPIPAGYIVKLGKISGKMYDTTGIRSVQVQHNRMNNVLTPLWWNEEIMYFDEGMLCKVHISIWPEASGSSLPFLTRSSYGGVDRGSTKGNVYKGSYTNAAKVAFARIGPGHEIYVGAVDLDPDVSADAAQAQVKPDLPKIETIGTEEMARLLEMFELANADKDEFRKFMGEMGIAGVKTVQAAFSKLTPGQAKEVETWLAQQ